MKTHVLLMHAVACAALLAAGCERAGRDSQSGVRQTRFPGQVTAGGGTSGQVLARTAKPTTDASYAGGTPGMAGGAGGTSSGAATAGTVRETGQGPSEGTTPPSGAAGPGTQKPPGDYGKPAAPAPNQSGGSATHRDTNASQAAPGR